MRFNILVIFLQNSSETSHFIEFIGTKSFIPKGFIENFPMGFQSSRIPLFFLLFQRGFNVEVMEELNAYLVACINLYLDLCIHFCLYLVVREGSYAGFHSAQSRPNATLSSVPYLVVLINKKLQHRYTKMNYSYLY